MKLSFTHITGWCIGLAVLIANPTNHGYGQDLLNDNPYMKTTDEHIKKGGYFKKDSAYIKSTSQSPYFSSGSPYFKRKSPYFQQRSLEANESNNIFVRGFKKLTALIGL